MGAPSEWTKGGMRGLVSPGQLRLSGGGWGWGWGWGYTRAKLGSDWRTHRQSRCGLGRPGFHLVPTLHRLNHLREIT